MQLTAMFHALMVFLSISLLAGALPTEDVRQLGDAYFANGGRILADSEVFPYTYTLNTSAPLLSTHDELLAQANVHNKEVHIERLNGTLMLLSSCMQQVGTLSGELEADIEALYPDQAAIAKARISVREQLAAKNFSETTVASVSERDLSGGILDKRKWCGGCIFFFFCDSGDYKPPPCDRHICVLLFCLSI